MAPDEHQTAVVPGAGSGGTIVAAGVVGFAGAVINAGVGGASAISMEDGVAAVNYASTAAPEETLRCKDRSAQFASLATNAPHIGEFVHEP